MASRFQLHQDLAPSDCFHLMPTWHFMVLHKVHTSENVKSENTLKSVLDIMQCGIGDAVVLGGLLNCCVPLVQISKFAN